MKRRLDRMLGAYGWPQSDAMRRRAVDTLIDIMLDAERFAGIVYAEVVREWAAERGWPEEQIEEFATMADTVYHTLRRTGVITR
jgi:hypothetical protein